MKNKQLKALIILATSYSLPILANDLPLEIGAFIDSSESIYVGGKNKTKVLPRINYQKGKLFVKGMEAGAILYTNENLKITGSVAMDTRDIDRGDSSELSDMENLNRTFNVGVKVHWKSSLGLLEAGIRNDITEHKGVSIGMEYAKPMLLGSTKVAPFMGAELLQDSVADYYYGVDTSEAKVGRSVYKVDDALILTAGIKAIHPISKNLNVMGVASIKHYDNEITDSPIVDEKQSINIGLGLNYTF